MKDRNDELTKLIKETYPLGLDKEDEAAYFKDVRINELRTRIRKTISDRIDQWNGLLNKMEETLGLEVYGSTYGNRPSLAGTCILSKSYYESITHIQTLVFSISILGPYYEVFGLDSVNMIENGKPKYYKTHLLTVSPEYEFQEPFIEIEKLIKGVYGYSLIPYYKKIQTVKNIQSLNFDDKHTRVGDAIFGTHGDHLSLGASVRGDKKYGDPSLLL